jgi:hypothetical protein
MLQWITCTSCGNSGVTKAESLPRELTCSHCGASRHVEADRSAQIISTGKREECVAQLGSRVTCGWRTK